MYEQVNYRWETLEIVWDKRSILILHAIIFDDIHEYRFFLELDKQLSTNILADRLKKLLKFQIIDFIIHPLNKTKKLYYITKKWISMIPIFIEIKMWPERWQNHNIDHNKINIDTIKKIEERNKVNWIILS